MYRTLITEAVAPSRLRSEARIVVGGLILSAVAAIALMPLVPERRVSAAFLGVGVGLLTTDLVIYARMWAYPLPVSELGEDARTLLRGGEPPAVGDSQAVSEAMEQLRSYAQANAVRAPLLWIWILGLCANTAGTVTGSDDPRGLWLVVALAALGTGCLLWLHLRLARIYRLTGCRYGVAT